MRILWPVYDLYKGENQPCGIMAISSILKQKGYRSEVVQADYKAVKNKLRESMPTVLAFSTPSIFAQTYLNLNSLLKKKFDVLSVFGGAHPTYFPELIKEEGVDAICIGEGEYPMLELVRRYEEGKSLHNIKNIWAKENKQIHKNPLRPLIQDLNHLPLPDHEIFSNAIPKSIWMAAVITGRGCPYNCTYCFNHAYKKLYKGKGKYIRRRIADNVLEELNQIKRAGFYKFIKFGDDIFTFPESWVEEFCPKYKNQIGLPFSCFVRVNHVTPDLVKLMKEAGCYKMTMGIETGNKQLRNKILKRSMSKEDIIRTAQIIKDGGIKLSTGNILALPTGSIKTDFETLQLNIDCKTDYAGVTLLQPYHGTEIHEFCKTKGYIQPEMNLQERNVNRISLLKFKNKKEKRQIENLQKLFDITLAYPPMLPLTKMLIRLPLGLVYSFIFSRWTNFKHYFSIIPPKIGWKVFWKRSKMFFKATKFLQNRKKEL